MIVNILLLGTAKMNPSKLFEMFSLQESLSKTNMWQVSQDFNP